mmetsp:Transcript_10324/g.36204  ORF Transcript_10324/g.36204 Transcript_10324/m.36204 type:complete len:242 (-) Transcript_10324:276-1001(-)
MRARRRCGRARPTRKPAAAGTSRSIPPRRASTLAAATRKSPRRLPMKAGRPHSPGDRAVGRCWPGKTRGGSCLKTRRSRATSGSCGSARRQMARSAPSLTALRRPARPARPPRASRGGGSRGWRARRSWPRAQARARARARARLPPSRPASPRLVWPRLASPRTPQQTSRTGTAAAALWPRSAPCRRRVARDRSQEPQATGARWESCTGAYPVQVQLVPSPCALCGRNMRAASCGSDRRQH